MPPNHQWANFSQSCRKSLQHFSLSIGRRTATYWMNKLRSFEQKSNGRHSVSMSKNEEIKKLRERIEALEFIKELQAECRPQHIIVELENWTGDEFSKKSLPESLIKENTNPENILVVSTHDFMKKALPLS